MQPTLGLDLDGVIARPATYFINLAVIFASRDRNRAWEPPSPGFGDLLRAVFSKTPVGDEGEMPPESPASASSFRRAIERVRYSMRFPVPDAQELLRGLQSLRRLVLVTNRNAANEPHLRRWLEAKGLAEYFEGVYLNETGEQGMDFKLRKLRDLGAEEYVEDNPEICDHLARSGLRVYFRRWPLVRRPDQQDVDSFSSASELIEAVRRHTP